MRLKYGTTTVDVRARRAIRPRPGPPQPPDLSLPGLDAFLAGAKRVAIVVADATRYTAVERLMPELARRLRGRRAEVVFANGLHSPTTAAEKRSILGLSFPSIDHDARRGLVRLGASPRGVPIRVCRRVAEADRVIVTGTVGVHYLAGWGGGWKMILPGCAGEETILGLHRVTVLDGAERCEPARLDGNPFREEIDACGAFFPAPAFAIQTVLAADRRVAAVVCGDVDGAHREAVRIAERWQTVPLAARVDRLIASAGGHPKDINLIQANKAIEHASRALRPGGELTIFASCPDGLGWAGFERSFTFRSPDALLASLRRRFHPYGRTAWSLWRKAERFRIRLVSSLPDALVRSMRMEPARAADPAPLAFPDAGSVLPVIRNS